MVLLYVSIPIMLLAVAIATVPLLATMRREERVRRDAQAFARTGVDTATGVDEELRAAA